MGNSRYSLIADVSSEDLSGVRPVLEAMVVGAVTETLKGLHVEGEVVGASARDLNRELLSAMRKVQRRTRLRAEWTSGGTVERFFDYVPKGVRGV